MAKFICESIHFVIWDLSVVLPEDEIMYYSIKNNSRINHHLILIHNITCDHKGQFGCYGTNSNKVTYYATGELDIIGNVVNTIKADHCI